MVVPVIPKQRQHKPTATKRFNLLINYLQGEQAQEKSQLQILQEQQELWSEGGQEPVPPRYRPGEPNEFSDILDYTTAAVDTSVEGEKCIGIRTHGVIGIDTASAEMNAVARMNTRCADPVYHFILSWPEHEKPETKDIFKAAEHAIKSLGFEDHQYVIAVHANTDNIHCHIAMNRVHPVTYKSRHIEWAKRTLHYAAREIEIEHGWTHDNGIYVVEVNGKGEKQIVLNTRHKEAENDHEQSVHPEMEREEILPAWHDPESMDSWLKTTVTKALKQDLPHLQGWQGLHAWLERVDITLKDTGGGGLRLTAVSHETGEMLQSPMSKGLRFLKRADLEKRWGPFVPPVQMSVLATDVSELTREQLDIGAQHVLDMSPDNGVPPPPHVLGINDLFEELTDNDPEGVGNDDRNDLRRSRPTRQQPEPGRPDADDLSGSSAFEGPESGAVSSEGRGVHGLPDGGMADHREQSAKLLPGALQNDLGNSQSGEDLRVRSSDRSGSQSSRGSREPVNAQGYANGRRERDPAMRAQRKAERAAARDDLRKRFQRYRSFVAEGDTEYFLRQKELRQDKSAQIKAINAAAKKAKDAIPKVFDRAVRLTAIVAIDAEATRQKLGVHAKFKERSEALALTRMPPLQWREWLYEQANRADKAALSALRGIVYQAQRDAKLPAAEADQEAEAQEREELEVTAAEYSDIQYKRLMARLLEEERKERAIRSNNEFTMRAHEVDALMISYAGIQWRVTGNGNVEYSRNGGQHLFTDRGNRVTFDRERVTDEEIKLALVHSREKFGPELTLTGEDPVFVHRMARLADDLGLKVRNPELVPVVAEHRRSRLTAAPSLHTPEVAASPTGPARPVNEPAVGSIDVGMASTLEGAESEHSAEMSVQPPIQPLEPAAALQGEEALRSMVLAIDPRAKFEQVDLQSSSRVYVGPLVAQLVDEPAMFAQHIGRGRYVLHEQPVPKNHEDSIVEVRYKNGAASVLVSKSEKERGR